MSKDVIINLWFNNNAKEAVSFYTSIFNHSKIIKTNYYTNVNEEITGHKEGDVLTIQFELLKMKFIAINAGPEFQFNPSISLMIECKSQKEIDHYWNKLSANPNAEQCGWLQDKYGLSWQIVPKQLGKMLTKGSNKQKKKVTETFMKMKKLNIEELNRAYKENK
jgi:predicted 3-demethylubiquinone-9 3-methyltransferase (glyoxalase superfamily)